MFNTLRVIAPPLIFAVAGILLISYLFDNLVWIFLLNLPVGAIAGPWLMTRLRQDRLRRVSDQWPREERPGEFQLVHRLPTRPNEPPL